MEKTDIKSLNLEELTAFITASGEKAFRAKQLYEWMHKKLAPGYEEMTNLPKALKERLKETCEYTSLQTVDEKISAIDGTRKYLFGLSDGNIIESVLMRYKHGNSVCISSQVGCRMGCRFCASTLDGLERNLRPAEMLDQIYRIQYLTGERVSNVVIMGSGEPLDNYDHVVKFIRLLTDEHGLNVSQRNVTLSTCGIVPGILKLADEGLAITLALSLHAPNDEVRKTLMPVAKSYKLNDVLEACHTYFEKTGRRLTFEYSLVAGVNDNLEEAAALAALGRWWEPLYLLAGAQGVLGCFNLLPILPLDGGRMLWLALCWRTDPFLADRMAGGVSLAAAGLLTAAGAALAGRSPFLLMTAVCLLCCTAGPCIKRRKSVYASGKREASA